MMISCEIWQRSAGALPRLDGYSIAVLRPSESAPRFSEERFRTEGKGEEGEPIEFVAAELKRSAKAARDRAYALRISLKRVNLKPKAKGK